MGKNTSRMTIDTNELASHAKAKAEDEGFGKSTEKTLSKLCEHVSVCANEYVGVLCFCGLTNEECPFIREDGRNEVDGMPSVDLKCPLPEFARSIPEVPEPVLKAIDGLMDGCECEDRLGAPLNLSSPLECPHKGCPVIGDYLKLQYLAKKYRDSKKGGAK